MTRARALLAALRAEGRAALVTVRDTQGSAPREAGVWMVVRPSGGFSGTIGGGALEWAAIAEARAALVSGADAPRIRSRALGPELGQCCGGRVTTAIEIFTANDMAEIERAGDGDAPAPTPLYLFGAGHVGRALVLALAPLPFQVSWIDSRADAFPSAAPHNVRMIHSAEPPRELDAAPAGALVLVMTHSHALDLDIVAHALALPAIVEVGLIGSATKRARFERRLAEFGLPAERIARMICPIGVAGVADKSPAAIAAVTAAQMLILRERAAVERNAR